MKKQKFIILLFVIITTFYKCSMPEIKKAIFEKEPKVVIDELKALHNFEDAGIHWKVRSFKDEKTHFLQVTLVNGENLSDDENQLKELGKQAYRIVFDAIENEQEYDSFKVVFVQKKSIGIASSTFSKGYDFKYEDIINTLQTKPE